MAIILTKNKRLWQFNGLITCWDYLKVGLPGCLWITNLTLLNILDYIDVVVNVECISVENVSKVRLAAVADI